MSDLISRQMALDAIANVDMQVYEGIAAVGRRIYLTQEEMIAVIENIPSAEPERKTGKWEDSGWKIIYKCSECGNYLDFSGLNAGRGDANFCPNCGARMEWE